MDFLKNVDDTVATWSSVHPDTDFGAMGTMLKINGLIYRMTNEIEQLCDSLGVTTGEFDVLATLRRHGPRAKLTPSFIAEVALVSPSGLTHRLIQLEKAGHIVREPDPDDRRSFLISITRSGSKIADEVVKHIALISNDVFLQTLSQRHIDFDNDINQCITAINSIRTATAG